MQLSANIEPGAAITGHGHGGLQACHDLPGGRDAGRGQDVAAGGRRGHRWLLGLAPLVVLIAVAALVVLRRDLWASLRTRVRKWPQRGQAARWPTLRSFTSTSRSQA